MENRRVSNDTRGYFICSLNHYKTKSFNQTHQNVLGQNWQPSVAKTKEMFGRTQNHSTIFLSGSLCKLSSCQHHILSTCDKVDRLIKRHACDLTKFLKEFCIKNLKSLKLKKNIEIDKIDPKCYVHFWRRQSLQKIACTLLQKIIQQLRPVGLPEIKSNSFARILKN